MFNWQFVVDVPWSWMHMWHFRGNWLHHSKQEHDSLVSKHQFQGDAYCNIHLHIWTWFCTLRELVWHPISNFGNGIHVLCICGWIWHFDAIVFASHQQAKVCVVEVKKTDEIKILILGLHEGQVLPEMLVVHVLKHLNGIGSDRLLFKHIGFAWIFQ